MVDSVDDELDFVCPLAKIEKMAEWVQGKGNGDECRPCQLAPLTSWYVTELKDTGNLEAATRLEKVFEGGDYLTISKELDYTKSIVGEPLKSKLEKYDCLCQTFKQE